MKVTRILSLVLALSLLVPMFAIGQDAPAPANPTAVAVAETVTGGGVEAAKNTTTQVVEAAKEMTKEAKEAATQAVAAISPKAEAKDRIYDALIGFLELGKTSLEDGMELAKDGVSAAGKFAGTQIPLVLQELIMLRRIETLVHFLVTIGLGLIGFYSGRRLWKWVNTPDNDDLKGSEAETGFAVVALVLQIGSAVIPVIVMVQHLREWILPWAAPRIYLIEYAVEIIEKIQGM